MEIDRLYGHIETILRMENMGNILSFLSIELADNTLLYIKHLFGSVSLLEQKTVFLILPMLKKRI